MIPKNKRHLIVNKEYSRLPYWTDEGYDDVQRSTSQKFVQDNYGRFPESENQLPYNDDDYQALEYQYQDQFHDPDVKTPPFNTENDPDRKPKDCLDFWNQLFPGHPTGSGPFIPDSGDLSVLNIYAKKCPVEYKDHMCCGRGLRVQGPVNGELESEQNYKFGVGNKPRECDYNFWAKIGTMWNDGRYTAPYTETEITDTMGVTARGGWSLNKDCLTWKVKIKPKTDVCLGRVAVTAPTMVAGASQTLTVQGWVAGEVYYWSTTTGSLDVATGNSVVYTAPATNPNCANNPTITLTCGGTQVDSISIAVNQVTSSYAAYEFNDECEQGCRQVWFGYYWRCEYYYQYLKTKYTCNGSIYSGPAVVGIQTSSVGCMYTDYPACTQLKANCDGVSHCIAAGGCCNTYTHGFVDLRTSSQKAAGCCPADLL